MTPAKTGAVPPSGQLVSLNFLVPWDFRRRVKHHAVEAGITQKELLHQAIEAWEEKHGVETVAYGRAGTAGPEGE
jgi:hypothetical protein